METFSTLLALSAGNSPVIVEFPSHGEVTRSFNVFVFSSAPEQTAEQAIEASVIRDVIAFIMTLL